MPTPTIPRHIQELLLEEAHRYNTTAFIASDPIQFPRLFSSQPDVEITSLLVSAISWGNRTMILRSAGHMLSLMGHNPHYYVMQRAYEDLPDHNLHRTFFTSNLRHFLRGLNAIYSRHDTLEDFALRHHINTCETPAWELARAINHKLSEANGGHTDSRCLPLNLQTTALKRLNMALRWLVRTDGIVDIGLWRKGAITPRQLYIPVDVHVGNTARSLDIITRRANDRTTAIQITQAMRQISPDDPCLMDYALFGIGINNKKIARDTLKKFAKRKTKT